MCSLCDAARNLDETIGKAPIGGRLDKWQATKIEMEKRMMEMGLGDFVIDEVALMFPNTNILGEFLRRAVAEPDVTLFNYACDHVATSPLETAYDVDYYFFDHGASAMRVECMVLTNGFSPLHSALSTHMLPESPLEAHMSFKVPDMDTYLKVLAVLQRSLMTPAQFCNSTYGAFSYWTSEDFPGEGIYLKPRVNMRDQGMEYDFSTQKWKEAEGDRGKFGMPGLGGNVVPFEKGQGGYL